MRLVTFSKAVKLRKVVSLVLISFILFTCVGGAVLSVPLNVYALPPALLKARTIGELIITILAGANTAVVSPGFTAPIYSNFGTSQNMDIESLVENGIIYQDNTSVEDALSNLGSGRPYNLDVEGFRDLMSQNWQTMIDNNLDTVMRVGDMANTGDYGGIDNLGQILKNVCENGYLALENTVAIIANPGTTVKVSLQNIIDAFKNAYKGCIDNGLKINAPSELRGLSIDGFPNLGYTVQDSSLTTYWAGSEGVYPYYYNQGDSKIGIGVYNTNSSRSNVKLNVRSYDNFINKNSYSDVAPGKNIVFNNMNSSSFVFNGFMYFGTDQEAIDFFEGVKDGTIDYGGIENPDIVNTENGNIDRSDEINPAIEQGDGLDIIPQADYEDFMNDANDNYDNDVPNILPTYNFINNYINTIPEVIPTQAPVVPDQPDINPKPTVAPTTSDQILNNRLPGLETKFPFCIPWDFRNALKVFEAERQAPKITWNLKIERFGIDETLELDFSVFDSVAAILRTLLLITYVVGLILATRQLIRG